MASKCEYYEKLQGMSRQTLARIFERLQKEVAEDLVVLSDVEAPERRAVAEALTRVTDAEQILAEEKSIADLDETVADEALERLEDLGAELEE